MIKKPPVQRRVVSSTSTTRESSPTRTTGTRSSGSSCTSASTPSGTSPSQQQQKVQVPSNNGDQEDDDCVRIQLIRNEDMFIHQTKHKIIETELSKDADKYSHMVQQKMLLNEIDQMVSGVSTSLDHLGGRFACESCDGRMIHLKKVNLTSNLELIDRVKFIPATPFSEGHFEFDLIFSGLVDALPEQQMKSDALNRTRKLIKKVNIGNAAAAKLASLKVQQIHSRNGIAFATPFDLRQRNFFLPLHCVIRPGNTSTEIRTCQTPNTLYNTKYGQISYNKCLQPLSTSQPRFYRFLLQRMFSIDCTVTDVAGQFNRVRYSYNSTLCCMSYALKSRRNIPTYVLDDCVDDTLYPIRHLVLNFGGSQNPAAATYCQKLAVKVFRQYNPVQTDKDDFLLRVCQTILQEDSWCDDIFINVIFGHVLEWTKLTKTSFKLWPKKPYQCMEPQGANGDKCVGDHFCMTDEMMNKACNEVRQVAKELLMTLCKKLTLVLNFSNFRLKHYVIDNDVELQNKLNKIISDQIIGRDDPSLIEIIKPTPVELHEQMRLISPKTIDLSEQLQSERIQVGTKHLGLVYHDRKVSLARQTISFVYNLKQKKIRSSEFCSYPEYYEWFEKTKPTFTRRTIFSLISVNQDSSGLFLTLYKARMKILTRDFLKMFPSAGWEHSIPEELVKRIHFNIELYFELVKSHFFTPKIAKYSSNRQVLAMSDGSADLMSISISAIFSTCLAGRTQREVSHICLQAYSNNIHMICIPQIEILGHLRLLAELRGYLEELESIGCPIDPANIVIGTDSMILIRLLKTKITLLQRKSAFKIQKAILMLHSLKLSPMSVAWIQQKTANFLPDHFSKRKQGETINHVLKLKEKIYDDTWMTSAPLKQLPGLYFQLPKIQQYEIDELKENHVLSSEWSNFETNYHGESPRSLLSAATKMADQSVFKNTQGNIGVCTPTCRSSPECCVSVDFSDKSGDVGRKPRALTTPPLSPSLGVKPVTSTVSNSNTPPRCSNLHQITNNVCFSLQDWKKTIDALIERKLSKGFNSGGAISILATCLKFGLRLKILASLGRTGRRQRQIERKGQRQRQTKTEQDKLNFQTNDSIKRELRDRHHLLYLPKNIIELNYGDIDTQIENKDGVDENTKEGGINLSRMEPVGEQCQRGQLGPLDQIGQSNQTKNEKCKLEERIFHFLTKIYETKTTVKNFKKRQIIDKYGDRFVYWEGRPQRNIFGDQSIESVRLRAIAEDCPLEKLILRAAHQLNPRNLHMANVSIFCQNVHISKSLEKLRKLGDQCPSCCIFRAQRGKITDKIKHNVPGPTSQLYRILGWTKNKTYHMIDLTAPCKVYLKRPQNSVKMYILMCLQLPLKKLTLIPIYDYSTEALFLGLLTYSAQIGGSLEILAGDAGSNLGPYQNQCLGFNRYFAADEVPNNAKIWAKLILGKRDKQLKEQGVFLKMVSNQHKSLNQVEACSAIIKETLYTLNKNIHSPLSIFDWQYAMRICEKAVFTRPLAATKEGRIFTPQYLLSLLSQQDYIGEETFVPNPKARSELVVEGLKSFEERINKMRKNVAAILTSCLIESSFFNTIVREEKIKHRTKSEDVKPGSIMFCSKLFAHCFDTSKSLIRLIYLGESRQTGVFKKIGKWNAESLITRELSDLYFVCHGKQDVIFENKWTPTFRMHNIITSLETQTSNLVFGNEPSVQEIEEFMKKSNDLPEEGYKELVGVREACEFQAELQGPPGEEGGGGEEDGDAGVEGQGAEEQVFKYSKFGRKLKTVRRFQAN